MLKGFALEPYIYIYEHSTIQMVRKKNKFKTIQMTRSQNSVLIVISTISPFFVTHVFQFPNKKGHIDEDRRRWKLTLEDIKVIESILDQHN